MRAILCRTWGEPRDLTLEEIEPPAMVDGGVRIRVAACGLNFADVLLIAGTYQMKPEQPFSPGLELAGEVVECAPGVDAVEPGDRVMAVLSHGAFAEEVVAPAATVTRMPETMDYVTGAAFPVTYSTAHLGLVYKAALQAGETLLVLGATGGVGLTAVEIGKQLGATVIAVAGGADKLEVAAEYGADHLIDHRSEDVRARIKEVTDGRGADVVWDPVGGGAFEDAFRGVARGGRMLIIGFAGGTVQQIPANILLVKNITVMGYYWGGLSELEPELMAKSFDEVLAWYVEGRLKPHVSHTFGLADAGTALETLTQRKSTGKVVLTTGAVAD
jgi:NADPH2:quinone reductase